MKLTKALAAVVCAALLSAGAISMASSARAQDPAADEGGGNGAASVGTQPDAKSPPIDVSGCWDSSPSVGTLMDQNFGSGYGWIGIIQNGANIKSGHHGSFYEFVWDGGNDWAEGPFKGKATANGFTTTGTLHGKCKVKFIGHLSSNHIVGTYDYTGCVHSKDNFINTSGTFDLPLNNSGCQDIIPPH
jgi:hypothetical protein